MYSKEELLIEIENAKALPKRKAIAISMRILDKLILEKNIDYIDFILGSYKVEETDLSILVSILIILLPVKKRLRHYPYFFADITRVISEQGRDPYSLLKGFEPYTD
jgi:hypothetical protein